MENKDKDVEIPISWDEPVAIEKGFELEHGCGVFFDLFHNCSCKFMNFGYFLPIIIFLSGKGSLQRLLQIWAGSVVHAILE